MAVVACIDLETTSLDVQHCSITEIALALYDTKTKTILDVVDMFCLPFPKGELITEEASKLTGITNDIINERGQPPTHVITILSNMLTKYSTPCVNYFVGHNSKNFDELIFKRYLLNYTLQSTLEKSTHLFTNIEIISSLPWIDTMLDIPYPAHITTRKLTYLCLEHGYTIANAHRALFDTMGVAHLLSCYDFDVVKQFNQSKDVVVVADVQKPWLDEGRSTTEAKKHGFRFDGTSKQWTITVKDFMKDDFVKSLPFRTLSQQLSLAVDL